MGIPVILTLSIRHNLVRTKLTKLKPKKYQLRSLVF